MKKLFLIRFSVVAFFCLLCVLPALAANIKIKGAVKDKLSKEPLIGATIRLLGTQAGAVTDMNGNFELNGVGVLEGMYDIEIKYLGYKTEVRRKVRVENGNLVILNLEMETDAQELSDVVVVAKKNRENENMALLEQQKAVIAEVFSRRKELPEIMPGVNPGVVTALDCPAAFLRAEQEMEFVEKNRLSCLTLKDEAYPSRLRECEDAPIVLFFKGNTDFNRLHVIDMVGTRRATDYGKQFCIDFLRDLAVLCPDVLVVSGLAYGIDIHAHRAALANHLPTVAVLAHGLDRIYPYVHRKTAIDMLAQGGLLTEFLTGTNPDKHNFVSRNRIVAGMSDATIVVESAAKGGSLITAELAEGYHRDCFAVPGHVTDESSIGCNRLIRDNKAALIQNAEEFVQIMGWSVAEQPARTEGIQRNLFPELTEEEELVVRILMRQGDLHINAMVVEADIPVNRMSALLFELEMKGVVKAMVGGVYHLLT